MKQLAILFLLCVAFGCSKSNMDNDPNATDKGVFLERLNSAPSIDTPKESLPGWLVVRINDYYETRPTKVLIYRCEWNKQTVYFILDTFSSCLCDFFTEDGERIRDNLSDCHATSKNWTLIYKSGGFVLNLNE